MNIQRMTEWIASHRVGISSKTMWSALMNVPCDRDDHPYDADDFSRCYDLYKFAELTKENLQAVVAAYPYYAPIVERWDELCSLYEQGNYHVICEILYSLRDELMELKGFTKTANGVWVKSKNNLKQK